ncbi:hypothetical protein [Paraburkholderia nodosa]|uniref:hypothetical protein n=1 Tax=Paraburkholderia nodosa TaxID=392320 RepID=UPI0004B1AEBC|nr:hypothetical protein [Paraburkholderia nodosa]
MLQQSAQDDPSRGISGRPAAMATVRTLDDLAIWDRNPETANRCAQAWSDAGLPARPVTDLGEAVRDADIVSCVTLASEPLIRADWLSPGSHLDLIGSFTPAMTEAEPARFSQAAVWVDTQEALMKSGDLLNAIECGAWNRGPLYGDLQQLCRGSVKARTTPQQRTVLKAVGSALEDLAAAKLAYRATRSR